MDQIIWFNDLIYESIDIFNNIIFIIIYFENISFCHANLRLDGCPISSPYRTNSKSYKFKYKNKFLLNLSATKEPGTDFHCWPFQKQFTSLVCWGSRLIIKSCTDCLDWTLHFRFCRSCWLLFIAQLAFSTFGLQHIGIYFEPKWINNDSLLNFARLICKIYIIVQSLALFQIFSPWQFLSMDRWRHKLFHYRVVQ